MSGALQGKTVLIVGGTKGIGFATARLALQAGAQVTITGRSEASLSAAFAKGLAGAKALTLDYTKAAAVEAAAAGIESLDCLILSASSDLAWGPLAQLSEDAVRAGFEAKFWGYWRCVRALAPKLNSAGSITLVAGAAARAALPGTSGVSAVNGAVEAWAKTLAVELSPLRVNTVSPGMTETEAYDGMPEAARRDMFAAAAARLPARRVGRPEEIAEAVLLAAVSPFMTGSTLDIDGGAHLAR